MREILHFPDRLDNADVLEFSNLGTWGTIEGDDRIVRYFAICQYPGDSKYYLFFCAGQEYDFDVIIDDLEGSIDICKERVSQYGDVIWHKK